MSSSSWADEVADEPETGNLDLLADALLAALHEQPADISTSKLGRGWRASSLLAKTATTLAGGRLRGLMSGDADAILKLSQTRGAERMVQALGQMKGLAMKVGQMLSYVDHASGDPSL